MTGREQTGNHEANAVSVMHAFDCTHDPCRCPKGRGRTPDPCRRFVAYATVQGRRVGLEIEARRWPRYVEVRLLAPSGTRLWTHRGPSDDASYRTPSSTTECNK